MIVNCKIDARYPENNEEEDGNEFDQFIGSQTQSFKFQLDLNLIVDVI